MLPSAKTGFIIFLIQLSCYSFAQTTTPQQDTVKEFEIIRGPSMRSIYIDSSTTLQTIAGGAIVKQGTTTFYADSIAINPTLHTAEAFKNVHINQADSVQTYADYLKYYGTEKNAVLNNNVKLYDGKSTLFTQNLDYNLGSGIGNYHNGGKVINGKTTITSMDGTYFADTKDIYFRNHVEVIQPKNHVTTDSLLYNMQTQNYNLNGATHIKNDEAEIFTTQGNYDYKSDYTLFTSRTKVIDTSNRVYIANNMALDNKSGNAQLEGNALIRDSAGGYTALANQIFLNKKNNSFLATRKPVLIIKQDNDSIYVAADTVFSGFSASIREKQFRVQPDTTANDSAQIHQSKDSSKMNPGNKKEIDVPVKNDSMLKIKMPDKEKNFQPDTSSAFYKKLYPVKKDTIAAVQENDAVKIGEHDSLHIKKPDEAILKRDSAAFKKPDSLVHKEGNVEKIMVNRDSLSSRKDSSLTVKDIRKLDSLKAPATDSSKSDSVRYFLAFHHVKIYNDSLQSVCDSLFFSAKDSAFRLFYHPVIWSGHSQITGDTMFLYTKNKKADRLYVFDSGFIVSQTPEGFFNQIAGKTINAYFKDGKINYARVRGSQAESIYYAQDADSSYLGMDRTTGDVIDLYFDSSDLKKVVFINQVNGNFYPMKKIPDDQKYLKNFIWLDKERPKNKLELFE